MGRWVFGRCVSACFCSLNCFCIFVLGTAWGVGIYIDALDKQHHACAFFFMKARPFMLLESDHHRPKDQPTAEGVEVASNIGVV
jgi:hypothetical protein